MTFLQTMPSAPSLPHSYGRGAGSNLFTTKFVCQEESLSYSTSLQKIVFSRLSRLTTIQNVVEFGSGSGGPVIAALQNSDFLGCVHGYEINALASSEANAQISVHGLTRQYFVHNISFFDDDSKPHAEYLIANPPYLPAMSASSLMMPSLHGGKSGNTLSKSLLDCGYKNTFLLVSSYSDPVGLIQYAGNAGYKVIDFDVTQMPFGIYSNQDVVRQRIFELKNEGKAFFSTSCYLLSGVLFSKEQTNTSDLSGELLSCLKSIGTSAVN